MQQVELCIELWSFVILGLNSFNSNNAWQLVYGPHPCGFAVVSVAQPPRTEGDNRVRIASVQEYVFRDPWFQDCRNACTTAELGLSAPMKTSGRRVHGCMKRTHEVEDGICHTSRQWWQLATSLTHGGCRGIAHCDGHRREGVTCMEDCQQRLAGYSGRQRACM